MGYKHLNRLGYATSYYGPGVTVPPSPPSELLTDLVAYYKFQDVNDSVGSRHLTNNGALFTAGKDGLGAEFSLGGNKHLSRPSTEGFIVPGAFTVALWIKINSTVGFNGVAHCLETSNGGVGSWMIGINPTTAKLSWTNWRSAGHTTAWHISTLPNIFTPDVWTHLAAVWNGTANLVYIDGSLITFDAPANPGSGWTPGFALGRTYASAGYYMGGSIDEFGYWSRELIVGEVGQLVAGSVHPF